ncbi:MAG: hypothetical protein D6791_05795 [Chloroflexi bacterium]|nr:MAG: hypothetical protein D6791_05795 [Chloroflexota bacterium]
MVSQQEYTPPSIVQLLGVIALILVVSVYGLISLNTGDLLWFWPKFDAEPAGMMIHCYGRDVKLEPGTVPFSDITALVNQGLSGAKRWDPLSLSDTTYDEYQHSPRMMTLEVFYEPPVRIHSQYKFFSDVDTLVVPLDGRHARYRVVFGRARGITGPGSFPMETAPLIAEYLNKEGLCVKPDR